MRRTVHLALALGVFLFCAAPGASAQSDAYMNMMRRQNQRMVNRARIYSSVRSGARITRYGRGKSAGAASRKAPARARRRALRRVK